MSLRKPGFVPAAPASIRTLTLAAFLLLAALWTFASVAAPAQEGEDSPPARTRPEPASLPPQDDPGQASGTPAPSPLPPPVPLPTDGEIRARVAALLSHDASIADHGTFQVKCEEGIVTVSGNADTLSILMQAERRAGDVRGVLDVIMQVSLSSSGISDSQILLEIQSALREPTFRGDRIAVAVENGEVHLNGTAITYSRKLLAERAAAEVQGVVSVQNNLYVTAPREGDDTELVRRIRLLLTGGLTPVPGIFEISVKSSTATLAGKVPLYSNRIQAERLAYSVGGIRSVENRLKVDPTLYPPGATVEIAP